MCAWLYVCENQKDRSSGLGHAFSTAEDDVSSSCFGKKNSKYIKLNLLWSGSRF